MHHLQARNIRNFLMHEGGYKISDQTLTQHLDAMVAVLEDPKVLRGMIEAQHAVTEIRSLQVNIEVELVYIVYLSSGLV